jgi:hypothetical protein
MKSLKMVIKKEKEKACDFISICFKNLAGS